MKHRSPITLFVFCSCFYCFAQSPGGAFRSSFVKKVFVTPAGKLPYRLLYPANYKATQRYPLVLILHGAEERGNDNEVQLHHVPPFFLDAGKRKSFEAFILIPQCPPDDFWVLFPRFPKSLSTSREPTLVMKRTLMLIDSLAQNPSFDPSRFYVMGYSMGGEGAFDVVARRPELFAAAVPVCSAADTATARSIKNIPLWAFHGDRDDVINVKFARMMIEKLKRYGGNPKYTEFPGVGHDAWDDAYKSPGLLEWMFAQRKAH